MISLITYFLRHYIICFFGALIRYIFDRLLFLLKNKSFVITFKEYRDYHEKGDQEFIDAIIGSIFLMIVIGVTIPFLRKI